jgi:hypothetical protein
MHGLFHTVGSEGIYIKFWVEYLMGSGPFGYLDHGWKSSTRLEFRKTCHKYMS